MPYSPSYSYNYSMPNLDVGSLMSQAQSGASDLMSQRYAGETGLQDARLRNALELARMGYGSAADLQRNQIGEAGRQFDVSTGLTREQMQEAEQQRRFSNDAAIREENWMRSLQNPANRITDPLTEKLLLDEAERRRSRIENDASNFTANYGGTSDSFMRRDNPIPGIMYRTVYPSQSRAVYPSPSRR